MEARSARSRDAKQPAGADSSAGAFDPFELGVLVGVLVGEGSFGGDGRQASITVRMHVRHESLFAFLTRTVTGSRLYGPYNHSGREYYQWVVRGGALRRLVPTLDAVLTPQIDGHAFNRYLKMKESYRIP